MIDTIIFDAEGVVIDTEPIWDKSQVELLRRHGVVYNRSEIKHLIAGRTLLEGVRIMQQTCGFAGDPEELARERLTIAKSLFETEPLHFVPGFEEFFQKAKPSWKTCIASSIAPELLDIVERRIGLSRLFGRSIFTISEVGYVSKPNPDIFLHAAKKMNAEPVCCVVIEDAPHGIEAAKRAGMKCIALTTSFERGKLAGADIIVDSFSQIDLSTL